MEMPIFCGTGIGDVFVRAVNNSCTLKIRNVIAPAFKSYCAPLQTSQSVIKKAVNWPGVNDQCVWSNCFTDIKPVSIKLHSNEWIIQYPLEKPGIAIKREAFPCVIEITPILIETDREARDNVRAELVRIVFPLLLCIAADKSLIKWSAYK